MVKASAQAAFLQQALNSAELDARLANQDLASYWTEDSGKPLNIADAFDEALPAPEAQAAPAGVFLRRPEFNLLDAQKKGFQADARRARAIARVNAVAQDVGAEGSPWVTLADEILSVTEARVALASCLSIAFAGTLDPERYSQIAEVERDERPGRLVDQTGQTRLFVSAGRSSGIDRKGLAAMIRRVSGLPDRLIDGIKVFDAFALVTVPFDAAERIIRESRGSAGIPRMRVAKEDGGGEGGYRARPTPPRASPGARPKGVRDKTRR